MGFIGHLPLCFYEYMISKNNLLLPYLCRVHHVKCQAGWITSWNQDCQEKYQQPHSNDRKQRGTKEPLDESEKAGLKLDIQKTKIMASSLITSQQIDGEKVETVTDFIFWAPKSLWTVTVAMKLKYACSLEVKLWQI